MTHLLLTVQNNESNTKNILSPSRGAAIIEFSLVIGITLSIVLAVFDLARIQWAKTVLHQALMNGMKKAEALDYSVVDLYDMNSTNPDYNKFKQARNQILQEIEQTPLLKTINYAKILKFKHIDPNGGPQAETKYAYLLPGLKGDWALPKGSGDGVELPTPTPSARNQNLNFVSPNSSTTKRAFHTHVCPPDEADTEGSCKAERRYDSDPAQDDHISQLVDYYPVELAVTFQVKGLILGTITPEVRVGGYLLKKKDETECTGIRVDLWNMVNENARIFHVFNGEQPQCLDRLLEVCGSNGYVDSLVDPEESGAINPDLCVAMAFENAGEKIDWFFSPTGTRVRNPIRNPDRAHGYGMRNSAKRYRRGNGELVSRSMYKKTYFMNENCSLISRPDNVCSEIALRYNVSPISLIWDQQKLNDESFTVVEFNMNPSTQNMWYTWKASNEKPLLVWDPTQEGIIKDGSQLFGTSTFGLSWQNGYEALATLDRDGDGKLQGSELDNISLWFDSNRDGVSDNGEVHTSSEIGLTTLYTAYDDIDPKTNDVRASLGFERSEGATRFAGASVDWFTQGFATKSDAIAAHLAVNQQSTTPDVALVEKPKAAYIKSDPFILNGAWGWTADDPDNNQPNHGAGVLTFRKQDGMVLGHTYIEAPTTENKSGISSAIVMAELNGKIISEDASTASIEFITTGGGKFITRSKAILSEHGELLGESSMYSDDLSDKPLYTYRWKGYRK